MTNAEIYSLSKALGIAFNNDEKYLPARINFFIQKNRSILSQISESIESSRATIIKHYGKIQADGSYFIPEENLNQANQELADLLNIEQEVSITPIKLSGLDGLDFTSAQMQALLFMIEED